MAAEQPLHCSKLAEGSRDGAFCCMSSEQYEHGLHLLCRPCDSLHRFACAPPDRLTRHPWLTKRFA